MIASRVPLELASYLDDVVARLGRILAGRLTGVYAGGSVALGAYEHGRSDVDVAAVSDAEVTRAERQEIGDALRHEALPCPARGLELVLYPVETATSGVTRPGFLLNLNSGASMPFRLDLEPDLKEGHWFAIDRSILAEHGVALTGPPATDVFAPISHDAIVRVLSESLAWHLDGAGRGDDAVLNAARALRYVRERRWSAKADAGVWAIRNVPDATVVPRALAARSGGPEVPWVDAGAFVAEVQRRIASG